MTTDRAGRPPQKGRRVDSSSADELTDEPLSQEIRLLGDLVLAASRVARHLTQDEVDQLLELNGRGPGAHQARPPVGG